MTIAFDAPDDFGDQNSGQIRRQEREFGPCGEGIDWSKGLRGLPRAQRKLPDSSGSLLTKVIEGEIIPRLFLAHRNLQQAPKDYGDQLFSCEAFARLVLVSESDEIVADIESLLDKGVSLDSIFTELLAPVARKLGEFWEEDICTFTDVTLGLSRLHSVLHQVGRRHAGSPFRASGHRAFFAPVPGEQHTFGVSMLEEFFHHAGWVTSCDHTPTAAGILHRAATENLDIIGFSIGCQELLGPLSDLIEKTRAASRNPDVAIMVGGSLFLDNRDLSGRFSNATIVTDGINAVQAAEHIVARLYYPAQAKKIV